MRRGAAGAVWRNRAAASEVDDAGGLQMRIATMVVASMLGVTGLARAGEMLKPGAAFPAWTLVDQTGAKYSSAELAGRTYLLWFFPKAMTSGCTKEGCTLRDNYAGFEKAGVAVVGVSFDKPQDNAEFIKMHHFPFRLLSDTDHTFAVEVGAADSPARAYARRISYLVGPDGKVLRAYAGVDPATHAKQVLADLAQLRMPAK
jgi:peroxiredoxin Q/BCP